MYVIPILGDDWHLGAKRFLKYMIDERGWKRNWLVSGSRFLCLGIIDPTEGCVLHARNDNAERAPT